MTKNLLFFKTLEAVSSKSLIKLVACLFFISMILVSLQSNAQVQITYPTESSDLVTCDGDSTFEVRLDVVTPFTTASVEVGLPEGVTYTAGSIMLDAAASTAGYSITESNISDLSHPVFSLTLPTPVSTLDIIQFKMARKASCDALDAVQASGSVSVKDSIFFLSDAGNEEEISTNNSYEILFPEIGTGNIQNLVLPDFSDTCRPVRIINGGLGHVSVIKQEVVVGTSLDNYRLYYKKGTPDEALLTPSSTLSGVGGAPDTFIYTIDLNTAPFAGTVTGQNSDGDNLFENGEVIRLDECFGLTECSQSTSFTTHSTFWECANSDGSVCRRQDPPRTGSAGVLSVNPQVSYVRQIQVPDCHDGVSRGKARIVYYSRAGLPFKQNYLRIYDYGGAAIQLFWGIDSSSVSVSLSDGTAVPRNIDPTPPSNYILPAPSLEGCIGANSYMRRIPYLLPDDLIIPAGDSLILEYEYVVCCGGEECGPSGTFGIGNTLIPTNICDVEYNRREAVFFPSSNLLTRQFYTREIGLLVNSPSTIADGSCGTFEYAYSKIDLKYSTSDSFSNDEAYLEVETVLPIGFAYTSGSATASNINGSVTPYYTDWDPVTRVLTQRFRRGDIYTSDFSSNNSTIDNFIYTIEACLDCAPRQAAGLGQTAILNQNLRYNMFPSCNTCINRFACNDVPVIALCPGPCPDGGGLMTAFDGGRINTCEADYDNDGVADIPLQKASLDSIDRKQILVGDTICYNAAMRAIGGLQSNPDDTWNAGRFDMRVPRGDFFDLLSATIVIQDRDPVTNAIIGTYTVNNAESFFTKTVSGIDATFAVSIGSDLGAPVPSNYVIGEEDSIGVLTCYRWTERDGEYYDHFNTASARPDQELVVDDIITRFNVTVDDFATDYACNFLPARVLFHGQASFNYVTVASGTTFGCNTHRVYALTGAYSGSARTLSFPNESRLLMVSEKVEVLKKPGMVFADVEIRYRPNNGNAGSLPAFYPPNSDVIETDSSWIIYPQQYFQQNGGPLTIADFASNVYTYFLFRYDCEANNGDRTIEMISDVSLIKADSSQSLRRAFPGAHVAEPPVFNYVQTPISTTTTEQDITFRLQSGIPTSIPCMFLEFISPSGFIELQTITDNNAGTDLVYNPATNVYESGPQSSSVISDFDITVRQNRCAPDSFQIVVGYACSGCPQTPEDFDMCSFDTLTYYIQPESAALQIDVLNEPVGPQDLCEQIIYEIRLNSSGTGDLINPLLFVDIPTGFIIDSMVLEYPRDNNAIQVTGMGSDPVIVSLSDHPLIDGNLPGTSSTPTDSLRQVDLIVYGNTSCDFVASSSFGFAGLGSSPCGSFAAGAFNRVITDDLTINGVTNPYGADIEIDPISDVTDCDVFTVSSDMTLFLIDPLNSQTFGTDTLTVELPAGMIYEGNYNCTSANPTNCLQFVSNTVNPDGSSVLKFKIPSGVSIAPDPAVFGFEFDVRGAVDLGCDELLILNMYATTEIGPIPCSAEPSGECDLISVRTGQGDQEISVEKSSYSIVTNSFRTVYNPTAGTFFYDADVRLDSALEAGEVINIEYYCLDASDMRVEPAILTEQISGPQAAGATVSLTGTIPSGCDTMNGVRMLIPQDGIGSNDNCICAADSADALDAGQCPVIDTIILDPNLLCNNKRIDLTAEISGDYSAVQWTTTGTGTLGGGGTLNAVYTPSTADVDATSITFCLEVTAVDSRCPEEEKCVDISPLVMKPTAVNDERCGPGQVTLTAESTDPDCGTFIWYSSETAIVPLYTGAVYRPSPSTTTTYYVACKNLGNDCESVRIPVTATIHPEITGSATNGTLDCGAGPDGMITVTATGGVAGGTLEYSIDNGASWQSSNEFTGLAAGTYLITVRNTGDVEGCELNLTATLEPYECQVTVPNPPQK